MADARTLKTLKFLASAARSGRPHYGGAAVVAIDRGAIARSRHQMHLPRAMNFSHPASRSATSSSDRTNA
jgi:hypothetical protein